MTKRRFSFHRENSPATVISIMWKNARDTEKRREICETHGPWS